jgi:hypothetical protein
MTVTAAALATRDFGHLHTSGRFDRTPASQHADYDTWLRDAEIALITGTEVSKNSRYAVIRDMPGWGSYNGKQLHGADDVFVAWRDAEWSLLEVDVAIVSTVKTYRTNGSLIPPQYVTTVLLLHKLTGRTLQVSVSHLPSFVEISGHLRDNGRARKWLDATHRWKRQQVALAHRWQPSARMMVADWNVSLRGRWFRRYLAKVYPALRPTWVTPFPKTGTLGSRIIDVALINRGLRIVTKAKVLTQHKSSDHRAFKARLAFR